MDPLSLAVHGTELAGVTLNENDPHSHLDLHIHVERKVLDSGPGRRNLISSLLGRAVDAPSVVTTGCGLQVPYAMTSPRPESVTCLACREHAHSEYSRAATQIEQLGGGALSGLKVGDAQVAEAAQRLRDLAKRFSS